MQIQFLRIRNFKSIRDLEIHDIENALILVGKNNTGKTVILDAIRAATGNYTIRDTDFNEKKENIEIHMILDITEEDLQQFHAYGVVSAYKRYDAWKRDFCTKLPSFTDGQLHFICTINQNHDVRYNDGTRRHNRYIPEILPKLYFIDTSRNLKPLQEDLLMSQQSEQLIRLRSNVCMFDSAKVCDHCFSCIGLISRKKAEDLELHETARLLEYQMYQLNLNDFSLKVNENYHKNGGFEDILFTVSCNPDELLQVQVNAWHEEQQRLSPVDQLGNGMKSIYMLSLLETYIETEKQLPSIIMVEYPELFLHPSLQKTASRILYRLSKKNQVIFTTHSPNMVANFTRRQVRQVVMNNDGYSVIRENADLDDILDDLGYSANDFLNVDFVFIVEGKQDKSRLPLLLEKYYGEIHDENGDLSRVSIITTNSCTNIKTYANLKYMNQVYLRDQFLMIRDGDGKDPEELAGQLCKHYSNCNYHDIDKLPKVQRQNVLILKYYSFENYFLNPAIMAQLGVVKSEEDFWHILFARWKEHLHRITSGRHLTEILGKKINSIEELKEHFEEFKIYMRGHNLYDIFYGRYRGKETELLRQYLELAPREDFQDILDAIEAFPYFDSRKKTEKGSE